MNKLQKKVDAFSIKNNLSKNPDILIIDLTSEIGELAKEIIKSTDYGKSKIRKITPETKSEIGDVLFVLIRLANELKIDLNSATVEVIEKYNKRKKINKKIESGK